MAGYIMTIGADEYLSDFYALTKDGKPRKKPKNKASSKQEGQAMAKKYVLEKCILRGTYSARTSDRGAAFIGTLADYLGMKAGDNIFFFTERKIYGIGVLINIEDIDCRFRVHPSVESDIKEDLLEEKIPSKHHFTCTFKPEPYFFKQGVDMDEVLMFCPEKIRALRFFSGMSFMKLDDVESDAIKNVIARKNEQYLLERAVEQHFDFNPETHKMLGERIKENRNVYSLSIFDYIKNTVNERVTSEYYIEGAIMDLLRDHESKFLGRWDFVGRQFPASPPKPSEYKESMDLFGYRYVPGFPGAVSKYLIIELKVGTISIEHVQQTMKYVDWICREYTNGDYSMVEAYTIGFDKAEDIEKKVKEIVERNYIIEGHPITNKKWQNLRILSYCSLLQELKEKAEER